MSIDKYLNMSTQELDNEIAKQREKIKKTKTLIGLLEKLKIANKETANSSFNNSKNANFHNGK